MVPGPSLTCSGSQAVLGFGQWLGWLTGGLLLGYLRATVLKFFGEVSPVCKVSIWEGDCPEEEEGEQ